MKKIILLLVRLIFCSAASPWVWVEQGLFKNDQEIQEVVKILLPVIRDNGVLSTGAIEKLNRKNILVLIDSDKNVVFLPSYRCQTTRVIKERPPVMVKYGIMDEVTVALHIFSMQSVHDFDVKIVWDKDMGKRAEDFFDEAKNNPQEIVQGSAKSWYYCVLQ